MNTHHLLMTRIYLHWFSIHFLHTTLPTFLYLSYHYSTVTHLHQIHFTRHIFGLSLRCRRKMRHRERWDLFLTHRSESLSNREAPASPVSGFLPNTDILYQSLWTGHRLIVSRNYFTLFRGDWSRVYRGPVSTPTVTCPSRDSETINIRAVLHSSPE
jgi:hypothetical protein